MQKYYELEQKQEKLREKKHRLDNSISQKRKEVRRVQEQLEQINDLLTPRVTEHATLRYIERIMEDINIEEYLDEYPDHTRDNTILEKIKQQEDIDIKKIRSIIRNEVDDLYEKLGGEDGKYTFKEGFQAVIRDGSVVSIIGDKTTND